MARSNDAYAWLGHYNVDRAYVADGLNRIMSAGGVGFTYDARGNLAGDGTSSCSYAAAVPRRAKSRPVGCWNRRRPNSGRMAIRWSKMSPCTSS